MSKTSKTKRILSALLAIIMITGMLGYGNLDAQAEETVALTGSQYPDVSDTTYWLDRATYDAANPLDEYAYSFALVGDTQILTRSNPTGYAKIYDWIVANAEAQKMKFVFGLGDITDTWSKVSEWEAGYENIHKLDGVVPYSIMRGNHDSDETINQYFPYSDYADVLYGSYDGGIENTWRELRIGAMKYLIFVLDYGAEDAILTWAGEIIEAHPEHNVIITTHSYLVANGDLTNKTNSTCPPTRDFPNANNGQDMWDELISKHQNIVLVLCGHEGTDEVVVSTKEGDNGNIVTQMLVNPQWIDRDSRAQGFEGVGMVAMMYFSEDGKDVQIRYYSTIHDKYFLAENQKTITLDTVEETPKTLETHDNLISISDFTNATSGIIDVSNTWFLGRRPDAAGRTLVGKHFTTSVTYNKGTEGSVYSELYYGTSLNSSSAPDQKNGIRIFTFGLDGRTDTLAFYIYAGGSRQAAYFADTGLLVDGEEYTLDIDISEQDDSGMSTIVIKWDGQEMLNATVDTTGFKDFIAARELNGANWTAVYRDNKEEYAQNELKRKMDEAPVITAADFGLEDGTHTSTTNVAFNKTYKKYIDGKKLVLELSELDVYHATVDPYWAALQYGNFSVSIWEDGSKIAVYTACRADGGLKTFETTFPLRIEIYHEYMDMDGDNINDDMCSLLRVNGTFMDLGTVGTGCTCGAATNGSYWLGINDKPYSETTTLKLYQPVGDDRIVESCTIASVNTHATATLKDGVLTISGTGKVYPSVLSGVVTDATVAATVKKIIIEDGITSVASNVFNGFTELKKVNYADSVQLVSDEAFVACATGVEVTCPTGKEFIGGLEDAFIVKIIADVVVPETGIVNPAVIVTRVDSQDIYNNLSGSAVAILNIDSALNILDADGQTIGTVAGFMEDYKNRVVPAFYMDTTDEATAIATYLKNGNNRDALYMVQSENTTILNTAKAIFTYPRGILEYDELPTTLQERGKDRREINKNLGMVAVYPSQGLTADIVAEYNLRGISVWSYAEGNKDVYTGISNGVNGLVTSSPSVVTGVYESITEKTLSGKPQAIAHRGYNNHPNSTYPENTLETFKDSVEKGSAALEMDIQLTKDLQLIVKSDANLTTGTDGEGYVSAYTLEELKELSIVRSEETTSYKIPSLREVFDEFKDTDVVLYLHVNYVNDPQGTAAEGYIANYAAEQLNALHSLVKEFEEAGYSIADNVIMFFRGLTYATAPSYTGEYGLSLMSGSFTGTKSGYYKNVGGDPYSFISVLNSELGGANSQQLPTNYDVVDTDDALAYQMAARGYLTLQTVYDAETQEYMDNHFINNFGSTAIMTNHPEYINDYRYQLQATDITCVVGDAINLEKMASTNLEDVQVACGLIYLSGNTLSEENGGYKATVAGTTEVVYYADITLDRDYGELTYRLYSAPVTITAVASKAPELTGTSLVLNNILTLNIMADLTGEAAEDYAVHVTVGTDETAQILSAPTLADGKYIYPARLLTHRMHETVTIKLYQGEVLKDTMIWNLSDYIADLKQTYPDDAALSNLLDALSNYGAYADYYADDAKDDLNIEAVANVKAEDIKNYELNLTTPNAALQATASVYLDDACDLRFRFNRIAMTGLDLYVDGILCTTEDFSAEQVIYTISDILPQDWDQMHTVVVKNGDTVVYELSYGVLSYAYQALTQTSVADAELNGLLAAMYLYNMAADAYLAAGMDN